MEKKVKFSLRKKLLLSIILSSTFIVVAVTYLGFKKYTDMVKKTYNDNAYVIGDIIINGIDTDEVAKYATTWQADDYYAEMDRYIQKIAAFSDAKYIYMMVPYEDGTMKYVYDNTGGALGDSDPMSLSTEEMINIYRTGEHPDDYYIRKSKKYGQLTSSILPVRDSSGNICCLLFVDVSVSDINSNLKVYAFDTALVAGIILIIFCIVYYFYINRNFLAPISLLSKSTVSFIDNNAKVNEDLKKVNTHDELEELSGNIYQMENDIVSYIDNIQKVTKEKERIGAELDVARTIQASYLPNIFPPFPERDEFSIYATMNPAKEVGGDFYDFFLIDDNHLGLVMADVSGKGVPAALFMMISKTLIKDQCSFSLSPAQILMKVNNNLCANNEADMFVTVWLGILDIASGKMVCANAGHEYPVIKRANEKYELFKDKHGMVCGGMEDIPYKEYEIQLNEGDRLFVYTDGVPEATNASDELFGTDRMLMSLNENDSADIYSTIKNVKASIDDFVKEAPQFDDITMMVFEYNKKDKLKIDAKVENLPEVLGFIEEKLEEKNFSMPVITQIDIAVEEMFVNIANYGYNGEVGQAEIIVNFKEQGECVEITLKDKGIPYNPLEKADPDITLSAEERPIGGLGIYMVKKSMDKVSYKNEDGYNIFTMEKRK